MYNGVNNIGKDVYMKRRIISVLLAVITVFGVTICSATAYADNSALYQQREQFNSQNNFAGGGFYGKNIYFFDNWKEKLYIKTSIDGKAKVAKSGVSCGGGSTIYKKYVYYIAEDSTLYRCALKNGKVQKLIKDVFISNFIVSDNKIIFCAVDPYGDIGIQGLYVCKLNGKGRKRITKHWVDSMYTWDKSLYYYDGVSKCYKRYSFKTKKVYKVKAKKSLKNTTTIGMEGKYIYVHKDYDDKAVFYRLDVKNGKVKKLGDIPVLDTPTSSYAVGGGNIYYCRFNYESGYANYYRYEPSTDSNWWIIAYPVDEVGLDIGFYKNMVVTNEYIESNPTFTYRVVDTINKN